MSERKAHINWVHGLPETDTSGSDDWYEIEDEAGLCTPENFDNGLSVTSQWDGEEPIAGCTNWKMEATPIFVPSQYL